MRYRSPRSIQAYQVVLADSHGIPRAPHYSGTNPEPRHRGTAYTTITHYGRPSQGVRLPRQHGTTPRQRGNRPAPQHPARNGRRLSHARGLAIIRFRSPLLTEYLFLRVLRCFTSPRSPHHPIHVQMMVAQHNPGRVPPFGHPRIKARSPTPRGISQAATSFISSWCQGIHRMPHKTTHNKNTPTTTTTKRRPRGPHAPPHAPRRTQDETRRGDARRQQRCSQPLYKSQTTHHNHHNPSTRPGPGGRAEPNTPPTKTGGGPPPKEGATTPPPKQEAAAPPKKRGGPRVLDVNPTARPSAHSSKAPMPNPTTRTRPTSTPPAEPTRPQAPRHHQPPPPAQSGRRGPTARRHHNRAP